MLNELSENEKKLLIHGFKNINVNLDWIQDNTYSNTTKEGILNNLNKLDEYGVKVEKPSKSYDFSDLNYNNLKKINFNLIDEIIENDNIVDKFELLNNDNIHNKNRQKLILINLFYIYLNLIFIISNILMIKFAILVCFFQFLIFLFYKSNYKKKKFGAKQVINLKLLDIILDIENNNSISKEKINDIEQSIILGFPPSFNKIKEFENYKENIKKFFKSNVKLKNINKKNLLEKTLRIYYINEYENFHLIGKIIKIKSKEKSKIELLEYFDAEKMKKEIPYIILPIICFILSTIFFENLGIVGYITAVFMTVPGTYFLSKYLSRFIKRKQ